MEMSSLTLINIQNQFNFYGYSILVVVGNIGNTLIIIRFWQQRQHACTLYILCAAIGNVSFHNIDWFYSNISYLLW